MIRLGVVSAFLPELPLAQVLDLCTREGFACVELMCWPAGRADRRYAGVTHIDVTALGGRQRRRHKEAVGAIRRAASALG